jgi:hypothetical protein
MKFAWSRRKLLVTGSAAVAGGAAAVAASSTAEAAPTTGAAPGVSVVESAAGNRVTVRTRTAATARPRQFDGAAQTLDAQQLPYGWNLRGGDLVMIDDVDGARVAVPLHREVAGRVESVDAASVTVDGQRVLLDKRTLLYVEASDEPVVGATAHHLAAGDSVVLQCMDNRRDGTLTAHFLLLVERA